MDQFGADTFLLVTFYFRLQISISGYILESIHELLKFQLSWCFAISLQLASLKIHLNIGYTCRGVLVQGPGPSGLR